MSPIMGSMHGMDYVCEEQLIALSFLNIWKQHLVSGT
jgi:hypothetical protein